jgi:hypothetical protein
MRAMAEADHAEKAANRRPEAEEDPGVSDRAQVLVSPK